MHAIGEDVFPLFFHHRRSRIWVIRVNDNHVICAIFTTNLKGYYDLEGMDYYLSNNQVHLAVIIHNKAII